MHVAFVNENTLGHGSYLRPFVAELERDPSLDVTTAMLDVTPLPPDLHRFGHAYVRGLRRWNLDFQMTRWRLAASWNARRLLDAYRRDHRVDAVVVNTQSVGLSIRDLPRDVPLFVAADATFAQQRRGGWFGSGPLSNAFHPLTLAPILGAERALYDRADTILVWSEPVRQSLLDEYRVRDDRIVLMPPSVRVPAEVRPQPRNARPRLLFIGGDFRRKGGATLVEAFSSGLADRCELHIVTQTAAAEAPGVHIHRDVKWGTPRWRELWDSADAFVFPSTLETFGIVLVEALAFGVPVISSDVGAARDILDDGRSGIIVERRDARAWREAITELLDKPADTARRIAEGRRRAAERYDLTRNAARLAELLHAAVAKRSGMPGPAPATAGPPGR